MRVVVNFSDGNTCLYGLPHRLAGKKRRDGAHKQGQEPEQRHVPWISGRKGRGNDRKKGHDGDACAKEEANGHGCSMSSKLTKSHAEQFLLLPFFDGALDGVFRREKPWPYGSGSTAAASGASSAMSSPSWGAGLIMALVHYLAGVAGFEPAISGLGGRCIIQLCYTPKDG